ncbi:MAG: UDP-N-acetylmuramoyl-L-alanine--D-glutamate ligase [Acidobacteriota bacterium]|nr:UDP-N-acetylmuramoyl-L-alanine--D-glutamate ligase [Acidobacteriota bacterium]
MEFKNKKVVVVGFGRTGQAVCGFLLGQQASVIVSDKKPESELSKVELYKAKGVHFDTGANRPEVLTQADLIVLSPGVPPLPEVLVARDKGIKVISEIELAYPYLRGKLIGITGSNGKSTTATLIYSILKKAGFRVHLAGNIGQPLISFIKKVKPGHIVVTELSSFQLEFTERFRTDISVFLNISPNHLDWHKTFDHYLQAKKKLFDHRQAADKVIVNRDDPCLWSWRQEEKHEFYAFSRKHSVPLGCYLQGTKIILKLKEEIPVMDVQKIKLRGVHNQENVMAAILTTRLAGASLSSIRTTIKKFTGLEHRLEEVRKIKGVLFVNDSKATTVEATIKAIESFEQPIILILGGRDKGSDFSPLRRALKGKVKQVLLIGEARKKIRQAIKGIRPVEEAATFRQLVERAYLAASPGDVVLLAPACTSWDMFSSFEERGRLFKKEVNRLARKLQEKK